MNFAGDEQADRSVHGGPDKAAYGYAGEDPASWATVLGAEIGPGVFGENLTTAGVEVSDAVIGERWRIGSTELEVCPPREPCYKLAVASNDAAMARRFAQAGRPGAYLRIIREGELGVGDPVTIIARPDYGITIAMVARAILSDHRLLAGAVRAPALPPSLAAWMRERVDGDHGSR